jgi:predicted MFS family arabinose efflux permease
MLNLLPRYEIAAVIIIILITLGEMLSMPFMNSFWINRTNLNNRGEYAALYSMSWSAAQVMAPFFGSELINYGGFNLLWWVLGVVSLITSLGYLSMYHFNYRKPIR